MDTDTEEYNLNPPALEPGERLEELFQEDIWEATPVYEKAPGEPVYIIGSEGENILEIRKPSSLFAYMATYAGSPNHLDRAIVERIEALFDAAAVNLNLHPETEDSPETCYGTLYKKMHERGKELASVLVGRKYLDRLRHGLHGRDPNLRIYTRLLGYPEDGYTYVFGFPAPEHLGRVIVPKNPSKVSIDLRPYVNAKAIVDLSPLPEEVRVRGLLLLHPKNIVVSKVRV